MVRQQRQDNPGEDQKLAGGDDFLDLHTSRQCVQLLTAGEQKNRRHGYRYRHPRRQRQGGGAKQVGKDIEQGHNEADIGVAIFLMPVLLLVFADMRAVIDEKPSAQYEQAAGKGNEMNGFEQIKRAASQCEQRKSTDTARPPLVGVREEFLKGEAEKKTQAKKQRNARR